MNTQERYAELRPKCIAVGRVVSAASSKQHAAISHPHWDRSVLAELAELDKRVDAIEPNYWQLFNRFASLVYPDPRGAATKEWTNKHIDVYHSLKEVLTVLEPHIERMQKLIDQLQ